MANRTGSGINRKAVLVDIDGTIADVRHRLHHIEGPGRKNWNLFFAEMEKDTPIPEVIERVRRLAADHDIVIVTGRPEQYRSQTEAWLRRHQVPYDQLFMRRSGDHRPDYIAKRAVLDEIPPERIACAFDDRPPVCDMWEKAGIETIRIQSDVENQEVNKVYEKKRK